ncbi:MAG: hypothetical protein V3T88_03620 [Nitrosomonadaceae bacterium]
MPADRASMTYHIDNQVVDSDNKVAGKIYVSEVIVSSSELLALAATAKELVAAPGSDRVLEFISASIKYNYGTVVYTESSDDMVIEYSGGQDVTVAIDSTNFIDQSNDEIRIIPFSVATMAVTVDLEALKNTSLQLFIPNDSPTLGDGTLTVRTTYRIHDFSSY